MIFRNKSENSCPYWLYDVTGCRQDVQYLALVWDLADPDAAGSAAVMLTTIMKSSARWHVAFEGPGIAVVYPREHNRIDRPYVFARNRGVVFGKLFWRDSKTESTTHVEKLDEHSRTGF